MRRIIGTVIGLLALGACTPKVNFSNAAYWERINVREAIYLNGSRAQTQLSRDIARCVTVLKEAQTITKLRRAIPGDSAPYEPIVQKRLHDWDGPERDRALLAEHYNFHNFEDCMHYFGWKRLANLPREDLQRARDNYLNHINAVEEKHNASSPAPKRKRTSFPKSTNSSSLNE